MFKSRFYNQTKLFLDVSYICIYIKWEKKLKLNLLFLIIFFFSVSTGDTCYLLLSGILNEVIGNIIQRKRILEQKLFKSIKMDNF